MIIRMAFRNIFRHKNRTALTLITMIFGIFLSDIGDGINQGLQYQAVENFIRADTAYYKVYGQGYYEDKTLNNPLEYLLANDKEINKILENKITSSQLVFNGSVSTGLDQLNSVFIGVIPKEENSVFKRSEKIISGDFLEKGRLVIGSELAELLKIKLGDTITILGRTINKTVNAYDMEVSGIIKTGNPLVDSKTVFLNLEFAKEFTDSQYLTDIAIMDELTDEDINEIQLAGSEVISYEKEVEDIMAIIQIRKKAFGIITLIILSMAGLGIVNTMLMSMLERRKEIGILMANGMSRAQILTLFIFEGMLVGLIGSLVGTVFGAWFNIYFKINGIPIPVETDTLGINIPIAEKLYTYFDLSNCIGYLILGIVIASLASFYPAWKASKLNPAEAVRG